MIKKIIYRFLSGQQEKQFTESGYTLIKSFISKSECQKAIKRIDEIIKVKVQEEKEINFFDDNFKQNLIDSADKIRLFYELKANTNSHIKYQRTKSINKIGHNLHTIDSVFREITFSQNVIKILKQLKYINPVVPQSMAILKPPRIGGQVSIHQDSTYLTTTPDTLLGFWIPFQKSTLQNGCLWFAPNTKEAPLYRVLIDSKYQQLQKAPQWKNQHFIPLEMEAGDLVIFNGRCVHKSEQNLSQKSRYAYSWHLYDSARSKWQPYNWIPKREFPNYY